MTIKSDRPDIDAYVATVLQNIKDEFHARHQGLPEFTWLIGPDADAVWAGAAPLCIGDIARCGAHLEMEVGDLFPSTMDAREDQR